MTAPRKIDIPENFHFPFRPGGSSRRPGPAVRHRVHACGGDVYHLVFERKGWEQKSGSRLDLDAFRDEPNRGGCSVDGRQEVSVTWEGKTLLRSLPGHGFGTAGSKWMLCFEYRSRFRFYGLGEKYLPFERTGVKTRFWNTDVFATFDFAPIRDATVDPLYISIPYLVVKQGNRYVGILVENPYPVFMALNPGFDISNRKRMRTAGNFYLGAPDGLPSLYVLIGPTLRELTRKLQRLCGVTPRPPVWSLGHHQCRWGYRSAADLRRIRDKFAALKFPNHGLWLDIDYMDAFKVFTFDRRHFRDPAKEVAALQADGSRVVPILDPGVKQQPGYPVYDDGRARGMFCRNAAGGEYVGFVWPGKTVFPDFAMRKARDWWASRVERFAGLGFAGAWIDMNDPSTGAAAQEDMRFNAGRDDHAAYHNQYATGMAEATRDGFLRAHPDRRPFLMSRSAYTGSSRWTTVWTGDNCSNFRNLRVSIGVSLNLALSGLPANGTDVGGFSGTPTPELMIRWYQAAFLSPILRNHTSCSDPGQEPWRFGREATAIIREHVRWRYKLLPYLYQLAIRQEREGDPMVRPLLYDFSDSAACPLDRVDDQFMVGPDVMQAPVVEEGATARELTVPRGTWYLLGRHRWIRGGRRIRLECLHRLTPVLVREGALIPMLPGVRTTNDTDLADIELHVMLRRTSPGTHAAEYEFDDGISFAYRDGAVTRIAVRATVRNRRLRMRVTTREQGYRPCRIRWVLYDAFPEIECTIDGTRVPLRWRAGRQTFGGEPTEVSRSRPVEAGR